MIECEQLQQSLSIRSYVEYLDEAELKKTAHNDDILLYLLSVKSRNACFGFHIIFRRYSSVFSMLVSFLVIRHSAAISSLTPCSLKV